MYGEQYKVSSRAVEQSVKAALLLLFTLSQQQDPGEKASGKMA